MAQDSARLTEAQENQVPPTLRRWVAENARDVRAIDRFNPENERTARGWTIDVRSVHLSTLPEGYELGNVFHRPGRVGVQVREE